MESPAGLLNRTISKKPSLWKNSYQPSLRKNSFLTMSIALDCLDPGCTKGTGGAQWKSPSLPYEQAKDLLDSHVNFHHRPHAQPNVSDGDGGRSRFEKMKRPTISAGLSLKDWNYFYKNGNVIKLTHTIQTQAEHSINCWSV